MAPINSNKRVQVDQDKARMFAIISVAAVVTVASLVISKGLWSQGNYLSKVAAKKDAAVKQLEANKAAVDSLTQSYNTFINQNPNLLSGSIDGTTDRDGTNATLILDALPNKYDFPALTASLEKLLAGHAINAITGIDDSVAQSSAGSIAPVEIPFSVDATSDYEGFRALISSFNRSIRPFQLTKLELSGTNGELQTIINGKTFYQGERGVQITEEQVQ